MNEIDGALARQTMRRVYWRVIPLLFLGMFCNYLDRVNIGFAGLTMNHDLGFSPGVFGFGASIFFLGYALLGVPSNVMMERVGARYWIPVILVFWGAVAGFTAAVHGAGSFYAVRFLLGMAEAGALPGFALFAAQWFPQAYRARAIAGYIIAGQVVGVIGGPVNAYLMHHLNDFAGLHGWQWLFIIEGGATVAIGVLLLLTLPGQPGQAGWLTPAQRDWLQGTLAAERHAAEGVRKFRLIDSVLDGRVYWLAGLFGSALVGIYGLMIWLPQIVKAMGQGMSLMEIGILSVIPPFVGVLGQLIVGASSDRTGERKFHLAAVYFLAAVCIALSAYTGNKSFAFVLLCIAGFGIFGGNPIYWSLATSMMTGTAGAIAIAYINSLAQFGGLVGPWMLGAVKGATGSFTDALYVIAAFAALAGVMALLLRVHPRPPKEGEALKLHEA
ncbi:MFS transporter [Acidocella facilis]|uniref:MFS transporter n=1 Tax=Acidocella facilis TaxID=525 RepID=UPI001F3DBBAE|nr:MFS transporter [Acidocella facilis]